MRAFSYDNLKRILSTERGRELVSQIKAAYEDIYEGKPIERATYADFMYIFEKNGDTAVYDKIDARRKQRLYCLQILSVADDKYIPALEEMLAEFCEQYAWFSSYHGRNMAEQTFNYSQIDLDTAAMSALLSTTYEIMKDKLRNDIKIRIRREIERRVVIPFENNPRYFGLDGIELSNWVATQTLGTGLAYLYVFPERLPIVKKKLFDSIEAFLRGITEDGYSSEGWGYWFAGFSSLSRFLDKYADKTSEDLSYIIKRPKVQNALRFGKAAIMKYGIPLPFSDHQDSRLTEQTAGFSNVSMKRAFGDDYYMYSRYDDSTLFARNENGEMVPCDISRGDSGYHRILGIDTFKDDGKWGVTENKTYVFPVGGAFISNREGYTFAAKAGHNNENHNHNDIGTFALFVDGKSIFPDVRSHKYDAIYFDNRYRYTEEVFAAGSCGHSVPIVDGKYQSMGEAYKGEITDSSDDVFEVNISGAYDIDISTLKVRYTLSESGVRIKYTIDEESEHSLRFRFIAGYEPSEVKGGFDVCGVTLTSLQSLPAVASRVDYLGHHVDVTVYTIDFEVPSVKKGEFDFEIKI